jgi:putative MFS transporter
MLATSAVPCLLVLPLRFIIPESPLWLTNRGQGDLAAAIVRSKLGAGVSPPATAHAMPATHGRWRQLFSPVWRLRTLVACAFYTAQVIPYFAVGTFVSQVMSAMNLKSGYVGGLFYNFALLGGALLGLMVVDHIPRRSFLIGSFGIAAAALLALSSCRSLPAIAIIILFAIFAGALSAASNLCYVYLPELFPTDLRASGIGIAIAASRIGSAVSTFLLPVVVAGYGVRVALGACVAVLAVGALICGCWAPETKHVRLGVVDQSGGP